MGWGRWGVMENVGEVGAIGEMGLLGDVWVGLVLYEGQQGDEPEG